MLTSQLIQEYLHPIKVTLGGFRVLWIIDIKKLLPGMERLATYFKSLRYGIFNKLPNPVYGLARKLAFIILYIVKRKGRPVKIAGKYPLRVKWERAAIDFATWESDFTASFTKIMDELRGNRTVIDVGASIGEWSALAASIVGSENTHVFEPDKASWNDIRKIFHLNSLPAPSGIFRGFAANVDSYDQKVIKDAPSRKWPSFVRGESKFENLLEASDIPIIKLDTYCELLNVKPAVIKIDVEGAEGEVLRGALQIIKQFHPILFLSLHPEMVISFGDTRDDLLKWVRDKGYQGQLLGTDHEEHWLFTPGGKN